MTAFRRLFPESYAVLVILLAGWLAYGNSLTGPFVFDDVPSIPNNTTIRHLWPPGSVLSPPSGEAQTVSGRPLVNLSFALNYAWAGTNVFYYHLGNVAIHLLAGLTLFGLVRRTLLQPVLREKFGAASVPLALAIALLWVVHPLQTEAVTYMVQRAESLMGLFYLLTLYCFVRGISGPSSPRWLVLSVIACFFGMATKEIMVTAPLLVFLYDRTFVAGQFGKAWNRRRRFYLALASSWLLLAVVMIRAGNRDQSMGDVPGVSPKIYALTELYAVCHYLFLSVWPHPLILDYGPHWIADGWDAAPYGLLLFPLIIATFLLLLRAPAPGRLWPAFGFPAAWFFLILAPSSSVVPIADSIFEHRMYLPLAGVISILVIAVYLGLGARSFLLLPPIAAVLIILTLLRNEDYRSLLSIWSVTAAREPANARAHDGLTMALTRAGRYSDAVKELQRVLAFNPTDAANWVHLGNLHQLMGDEEGSIGNFNAALRPNPNFSAPYLKRGLSFMTLDRFPQALADFRRFCVLAPQDPNADYARLWIWLVRVRQNQKEAADRELAESREHAWNAAPDDLVSSEAGFLLGKTGEDRLLAAARSPDPEQEGANFCEVWYYVGMKRLLDGNAAAAQEAFRQSVAGKRTDCTEFVLASAALRPSAAAP